MKVSKIFAWIFAIAAIAAAAATLYVCRYAMTAQPKLLAQSTQAMERADAMMQSACHGDYDAVGSYLYGKPSLGKPVDDTDETMKMLWDAFTSSISYEFPGALSATNSGVSMPMHVRCMDIADATEKLQERAKKLLEQRVEEAENVDEIYDENDLYREDFVQKVLTDATAEILQEDTAMLDKDISIFLVYEGQQWWVVPDNALLNILAGALNG